MRCRVLLTGLLAVSCLAVCPILSRVAVTGDAPANKRDVEIIKELDPEKIADEWLSKAVKAGGMVGSIGTRPNKSRKFHAASFTSGAKLEELWNFYAQKCGMDMKYNPKKFTLSGPEKGKFGTHFLLEQLGPDRHTLFGLDTADYIVSVTLHSLPGKSVTGTVVVVLH